MEKLYNFILETLNKAIKLSLTFLCLGVIIQLLINDELLNWDPVGNWTGSWRIGKLGHRKTAE